MTRLSVNVNKIALLRNQRHTGVPDVAAFAAACLDAGAHGITVHPRPDGRHIRPGDVAELGRLCQARNVEFNIEGNPLDAAWLPESGWRDWLSGVLEARPDQATLVPDATDQATSDHGFDCREADTLEALSEVVKPLQDAGIRVSVFVDAEPEAASVAAQTGCERVELYTGPYAAEPSLLAAYDAAAEAARSAGLGVNAGHDLDLTNLPPFLDRVRADEVSIGHAFTADCLLLGVAEATARYLACCR